MDLRTKNLNSKSYSNFKSHHIFRYFGSGGIGSFISKLEKAIMEPKPKERSINFL